LFFFSTINKYAHIARLETYRLRKTIFLSLKISKCSYNHANNKCTIERRKKKTKTIKYYCYFLLVVCFSSKWILSSKSHFSRANWFIVLRCSSTIAVSVINCSSNWLLTFGTDWEFVVDSICSDEWSPKINIK